MILVTGATSTVGRALNTVLQQRNASFCVLVQKQEDAKIFHAQNIPIALGDLTSTISMRHALQDIDTVYLLSPGTPELPDIEHTLVTEAKKAKLQHIVKHSIIGADKESPCSFLRWHGSGEEAIQQSGIPYTFLRINAYMQNLAPSFADSVIDEGTIYAPMNHSYVSYIDIHDIAEVAATVLMEKQHIGKIYDLTGPEAISYAQIAEKLSTLLDKQVKYIPVHDDTARQAMASTGLPPWKVQALISLFHFYRNGGGAMISPAVTQITGHPARTIDAYLSEHIGAFRAA